MTWRKSTHCGTRECAEVTEAAGGVLIRDSKDPDGPRLAIAPEAWRAFTAGLKG